MISETRQLLNDVIWHSVRGRHTPMAAPVHTAFFITHAKASKMTTTIDAHTASIAGHHATNHSDAVSILPVGGIGG